MGLVVMTLDLASKVGWCAGDISERDPAEYGTWILPRGLGAGAKFCALENELAAALEKFQPDRILLEAPLPLQAVSTANVVNQQRGLRACAYAEAYRAGLGMAISEIDSWTPREEILGLRRGRSKTGQAKEAVLRWAKRKGWNPADDNAADAILLWAWQKTRLAA